MAPTESYQLGSLGTQEGFIWTCVAEQRVHLWRNCGEILGCGSWHIERNACGAAIASEPALAERQPMTHLTWH
jgi:hypothetical protein